MNNTYIGLEELKKQYPDEWILLGNPEMENTSVLGGIMLYHSKDKKEVYAAGRDLSAGFETVTVAFAGDIRQHRKIGILQRL